MSVLTSVTGSSATLYLAEAEDLLSRRLLGAAIEAYRRSQEYGADADSCSGGRWLAHMLLGDFGSAWQESDAVRRRGASDPQRVIVRCQHGFGDAVQFLRYAPLLQEIAGQVIFEVPPQLLQLAPYFHGIDNVVTWGEQRPFHPPVWDAQIEIMELPYLFRTQQIDLPIATNYIDLPANCVHQVSDQMGTSPVPRVGIVWSSGDWNPSRSVPFPDFCPLLQTSGYEFWNLQGGLVRYECSSHPDGVLVHDIDACSQGILPLAAVISQLDLVITVDTLAAHLAGALGVPAWVMLQHAADWRWMVNREDSPWYPSLRLFRQPSPGDWASVIQQAEACLRQQFPSRIAAVGA
jgi:hypothetical protein